MAKLSVADQGKSRWIRFEGELDQSDVLDLKASFDEAVEGWDGDIVLDLGGVTFLGTLGIGLIVSTLDRLDEDDRALRLANVPEFVERTFRTMNLDEVFERA
ncbi:MAG TPA: STAS domain-containing protein [Planctomycetota bacterium]|nr:STAS domain-containing protein [Planctomycetota bacterium]